MPALSVPKPCDLGQVNDSLCFFGDDENVLKLDVVMVVRIYEYIKNN